MSLLDPRIAPPRTLVELREDTLERIPGNGYPGRGIRLPDAQTAMAAQDHRRVVPPCASTAST